MARNVVLGEKYERKAATFLLDQGLKLHTRNFRCRYGEIDLIMQDGDVLVFVEVRFRTQTDYGTPLDTLTNAKQKKLLRAAEVFLQQHPKWQQHSARFDCVGINGVHPDETYDWVRGAFAY